MIARLAPWIYDKNSFEKHENSINRFEYEIKCFAGYIEVSEDEKRSRETILTELIEIVKSKWMNVEIVLVGSTALSTCISLSDIDISINNTPIYKSNQHMDIFASMMKCSGFAHYVKVIKNTDTPIVKLTPTTFPFNIDVTFNASSSLRSRDVSQQILDKYPLLREFLIFMKYYLYQKGISNSYNGGISSFLLFHMCVAVIQKNIRDQNQFNSISELVLSFFKYFGIEFDFEKYTISISGEGNLSVRTSNKNYFSIISILDNITDLGKSSYHFDSCHEVIKSDYIKLQKAIDDNEYSIVSSIIQSDLAINSRWEILRLENFNYIPVNPANYLQYEMTNFSNRII